MNASALPVLEPESRSPSPLGRETLDLQEFLGEMIEVLVVMNNSQDEAPTGCIISNPEKSSS